MSSNPSTTTIPAPVFTLSRYGFTIDFAESASSVSVKFDFRGTSEIKPTRRKRSNQPNGSSKKVYLNGSRRSFRLSADEDAALRAIGRSAGTKIPGQALVQLIAQLDVANVLPAAVLDAPVKLRAYPAESPACWDKLYDVAKAWQVTPVEVVRRVIADARLKSAIADNQ